ncbi:CsbD family protein [Bdellovibrio sp.]|uniref:CsbD family protein n=1 Tax=Bdellovibrio sp. TaxID=28201 RepID=UPI0039E50483
MMHTNIPETDWKKVKSEIQKTWSGLSGNDLEKTYGDVRAISGLVQKKYGLKRDEAERKLDEVIERCGTAAGKASPSSSRTEEKRAGAHGGHPKKSERR